MKMYDKTKEVMDGVKDMMDTMFKESFSIGMVETMEGVEFDMFKKSINLINKSYDLALMQAQMIDEQNAKLDELLVTMNKLMKNGES